MSTIEPYLTSQGDGDAPKGSASNPYTFEECEAMLNAGTWTGGYVVGYGFIKKEIVINGSVISSDETSDSSDDSSDDPSDGLDFSDSDIWGSDDDPIDPSDDNPNIGTGDDNNDNNNGGNDNSNNQNNNNSNSGGQSGGSGSSGGSSSSGGSDGDGSNNGETNQYHIPISDVLPKSAFSGYKASEPAGCFSRCKEMLSNANCMLGGNVNYEILMANSDNEGRATTAATSFSTGVDYIYNQLQLGHPVVVAVDHGKGTSVGPSWQDHAGNHFVIIVGGNESQGFHFFDPATSYTDRGTRLENKFVLENGLYICTNTVMGKPYILNSIRMNK